MIVHFINVGPSDVCWKAEAAELTYDFLYREITEKGCLLSSDIHFRYSKEKNVGLVVVGGVRVVGRFSVEVK